MTTLHIVRRYSFLAKLAASAALIGLGDWLVYSHGFVGPGLGLFALVWTILTIASHKALRHDHRARAAGGVALLGALVLVEDPSLLAWTIFGAALTMAVMLPRTARFDDAWQWSQRLLLAGLAAIAGPVRDARRLLRPRRSVVRKPLTRFVPLLALPLLGGTIFLALFANANPLIGNALASFRLPVLDFETILRLGLWSSILTLVWTTLRPRKVKPLLGTFGAGPNRAIPGVSVISVTLSLLLFNALFALVNMLDIAFLWSGAELPGDMKMKDYVHRGAYPLIATALLAALFVLVTLRPGSETASRPLIRGLVLLWIAQNVLLVASSIFRTLDYIDSYLLTELRIAALAWMGLVATGLVLICWRLMRNKSAAWLINANSATALVVLAVASVVDLGAVAATWNVRHAQEVGGRGAPLDICYLGSLGSSALLPLTELAKRTPPTEFGDRVRWARQQALSGVVTGQSAANWTFRNARRLAAAERSANLAPRPTPKGFMRHCNGRLLADPLPKITVSPSPLTAAPPR